MPHRDDDPELLHSRRTPEPEPDDPELLPCPHCLGVIYDESVRCPHCGMYLTEEEEPARKPWWVVVGALLCLAAALYWVIP